MHCTAEGEQFYSINLLTQGDYRTPHKVPHTTHDPPETRAYDAMDGAKVDPNFRSRPGTCSIQAPVSRISATVTV